MADVIPHPDERNRSYSGAGFDARFVLHVDNHVEDPPPKAQNALHENQSSGNGVILGRNQTLRTVVDSDVVAAVNNESALL